MIRLSVYEKLFTKAFTIGPKSEEEIAAEIEAAKTTDPATGMKVPAVKPPSILKREVADPDLVEVYEHMTKMREALALCHNQFIHYAEGHEVKRGGHMSLVETQQLEEKIERNRGIAKVLEQFLDPTPSIELWMPISAAPQDGSRIRALGRRTNGQVYVETTYWWNTQWAITLSEGFLPPTHFRPVEVAPEGY